MLSSLDGFDILILLMKVSDELVRREEQAARRLAVRNTPPHPDLHPVTPDQADLAEMRRCGAVEGAGVGPKLSL